MLTCDAVCTRLALSPVYVDSVDTQECAGPQLAHMGWLSARLRARGSLFHQSISCREALFMMEHFWSSQSLLWGITVLSCSCA